MGVALVWHLYETFKKKWLAYYYKVIFDFRLGCFNIWAKVIGLVLSFFIGLWASGNTGYDAVWLWLGLSLLLSLLRNCSVAIKVRACYLIFCIRPAMDEDEDNGILNKHKCCHDCLFRGECVRLAWVENEIGLAMQTSRVWCVMLCCRLGILDGCLLRV